jgi:hypothetical protein
MANESDTLVTVNTKSLEVRQLEGLCLEWAVCQCEKIDVEIITASDIEARRKKIFEDMGECSTLEEFIKDISPAKPYLVIPGGSYPDFGTNWGRGGQIIARVGIDLHQHKEKQFETLEKRFYNVELGDVIVRDPIFRRDMVRRPITIKSKLDGKCFARLSTSYHLGAWTAEDFMSSSHLLSAMRCYVHSVFGETIEIPISILETE